MPVRLVLARACPEMVAMNDERLFLFVASFVDDGDATLLRGGLVNRSSRCRFKQPAFALLPNEVVNALCQRLSFLLGERRARQ
jgi:hypothetical protein